MSDSLSKIGAILLVPAVLFGLFRASAVVGELREEPPSLPEARVVDSRALLPGTETLAASERIDRLAGESRSQAPTRSPFLRFGGAGGASVVPPVPRPRVVPGKRAMIPRVVLVLERGGGENAVVIELGEDRSGPLMRGEAFQGWRIEQIDVGWVLIGRDGIIYTLPAP